MAITMSDEQERWIRKALSLSPAEHGGWPDVAKELVIELDALRERLAQAEARWNATAGTTQRDYAELQEQQRRYSLALAAREAENVDLRAALYPLVVGCLTADANEDAPEFVSGEAERGRDALPKCGRCGGCGALDGVEYVDVAIPEALRCPGCGGWGFLKHPRPAGSDAALRARTRDAVVAGANWQKWHHGTYEPERQRAFEAIVARLLEPRSDTPEADKKGAGDA